MEFSGRRKNGEVFPVEACFSGWQGTDGFQYGAILRDISVRKREAERIRYLAEHDSLTGLANRISLHEGLAAMIAAAEGRKDEVALLVVGLDAFQQINDMLGHACGDLVLCAVAERLNAETAGAGVVARLSGDEFAIAVPCAGTSFAARPTTPSATRSSARSPRSVKVSGWRRSLKALKPKSKWPASPPTAAPMSRGI
jgi:GGDEF domain-containing protein